MRILDFKYNRMSAFSKRVLLMAFVFLGTFESYAQYSDLHYLPPLKQIPTEIGFRGQSVYVTTLESTAFQVKVYRGNNTGTYTTFNVSKFAPQRLMLPDGDNNITLTEPARCGSVQTNIGLRFESTGGKKFYVNYEGTGNWSLLPRSTSQLFTKGRAALGTSFKWGGVPNRGINTNWLNSCLGIMATENGTQVKIFGYDPGCTFRSNASSPNGITADEITITLNKGETYVLEAVIPGSLAQDHPNRAGWLGASIKSNKNIAVSFGELNFNPTDSDGQDAAMDQILPENAIGKEYIFVRGKGPDSQEVPVIVATQDNTNIYINGNATPVATINNGDYFQIPATYYSATGGNNPGATMFVTTSKEAYAFQAQSGSNGVANQDINFITPLNCFMSNTINYIQIETVNQTSVGFYIITKSTEENQNIIVKYGNSNTVSLATLNAAQRSVAGTSDWKVFYLPGIVFDVSVVANGPVVAGYFGNNYGEDGSSAYISTIDNVPQVTVDYSGGGGCIPNTVLRATAGFGSYEWYKDGVLIPNQTNNTYTPTEVGKYYAKVFRDDCVYQSPPQVVYNCNPEIVVKTTSNKNSMFSGETVTFSVSVKYFGFNNVTNLILNNAIPSSMTVNNATASYGTVTGSGSNRAWNIGTMRNGEEHVLTIVATANTVANPITLPFSVTKTQQFDGTEANTSPDDFSEYVTVSPSCTSSLAGTISGSTTVCSGTNSTLLALNNWYGDSLQWEISDNNSNFSSINNENASTFTVQNLTATKYYRVKVIYGGSCIVYSPSVTMNVSSITPTFTNQPGATAIRNSDVTYTTQSGQSNYIWTISGTVGTDYSITSGGTTSSNTVVLKWLTTGNKTVTINYSNSNNCYASVAVSSIVTTVSLNSPSLSNFPALTKNFYDRSFTLNPPTSTSPGAFSYVSSNTAVATTSGRTITFISPGTTTITANQAQTPFYQSAAISFTLTVTGVTVKTRSGAITTTNLNYASRSGALSGKKGKARSGQIVIASTSAEIQTLTITNLSSTTATATGTVISQGESTITARGFCWNTTTNPTIENSTTSETGTTGALTSTISGLTSGTTYYFRAYTTNSSGTSYGNEVSFIKP